MRFYSTAVIMLFLVVGSCRVWAAGQGFVQTGSTSYSVSADGLTNRVEWTSLFYDHQGNPIRSVIVVSNYDGMGVDLLNTVTCVFDKHGELLSSVEESDYRFDGVIDGVSTTTHIKLSETQTRDISETDWGNDGIIDVTSLLSGR